MSQPSRRRSVAQKRSPDIAADQPRRHQAEDQAEDQAEKLAALANLGPRSAEALVAAGIKSLADLQGLGSVAAYARVKQASPWVTLNLLWALEGALSGLPWQVVAREHRTSLLLALDTHQNEKGG